MLGIVGTFPAESFPITCGEALLSDTHIIIGNHQLPINRGTPAMIAAAAETLKFMNAAAPFCYMVGDIGNGNGCKQLYHYLADNIHTTVCRTLAFHYFQPELDLFLKILTAIEKMPIKPTLIADAGFMYVAKMSGYAASFDLFTPDAGELAYLADEKAPHPFYTRGFILHTDNDIPDLIKRAYQHNNAATNLLVKGATDYIANKDGIIAAVDSPSIIEMEPIGGTGDTLTGIASALVACGMDIPSAATKAARINRLAGCFAQPTPATQVHSIIKQIPHALDEVLSN